MSASALIRCLTRPVTAAVLAASASAFAVRPSARADLGWFDLSLAEDRPHVSFAEVIAWSDACLAVKAEEWPAVERVYAEYVKSWNGDGRDEDKLWDGLGSALGADRANCLGAFRATTEALLRARDTTTRHVVVRRELLALAATQGPLAADAQRVVRQLGSRIADSVAERAPSMFDDVPPAREVLDVRDAIHAFACRDGKRHNARCECFHRSRIARLRGEHFDRGLYGDFATDWLDGGFDDEVARRQFEGKSCRKHELRRRSRECTE